jgi:hypothetical protein
MEWEPKEAETGDGLIISEHWTSLLRPCLDRISLRPVYFPGLPLGPRGEAFSSEYPSDI